MSPPTSNWLDELTATTDCEDDRVYTQAFVQLVLCLLALLPPALTAPTMSQVAALLPPLAYCARAGHLSQADADELLARLAAHVHLLPHELVQLACAQAAHQYAARTTARTLLKQALKEVVA